jgi:DNA-binding transcriptional LysR family regulator
MTFKQFLAFATVVKQRSVTKAAHVLHTSQPTLSKHLKMLERDLKTRLFVRDAKGIQLTEEGHDFFHYIEPIIEQLEKIEQRYHGHSRTNRKVRTLHLGGSYGPSSEIIPTLIAVFKKTHPDLNFSLRTTGSSELQAMVQKGELEVVIVSQSANSAILHSEPFVPMKITAFTVKKHPLAKKPKVSITELANSPLIIRGGKHHPGTTDSILEAIQKKTDVRFNIIMRCESPESLKTAVSELMTVGVVNHDAIKHAIERGGFKELRVDGVTMETQSYIVYHSERELSRDASEFIQLLRHWRDKKLAGHNLFSSALAGLLPSAFCSYEIGQLLFG